MKKKVVLSNILMYKSIVDTTFQKYIELASQFDALNTGVVPDSDEINAKMYHIQENMDKAAAIILVFSEMTIEAFCNAVLMAKLPKGRFESKTFIEKVKLTTVKLLEDGGTTIAEDEASRYYGDNIPLLISIRKKLVHTYPVCFELDLESESEFQKNTAAGTKQIEECFLRRIDSANITKAATAYQQFIKTLKEGGASFSAIDFVY